MTVAYYETGRQFDSWLWIFSRPFPIKHEGT